MAELADRVPGETVLASFHSAVKERSMMRYANLAALEASVAVPDMGSFAYLNTYPWPRDTTAAPDNGAPMVWKEDAGDGSPFGGGNRWSALLTDAGAQMFGPLIFAGGAAGTENTSGQQVFRVDVDSTNVFRVRIVNASDGLSGANMLYLGNAGDVNYIRMPQGGGFGIRERTGNVEPFNIDAGGPISFARAGDDESYLRFRAELWTTEEVAVTLFAGKEPNDRCLGFGREDGPVERALATTGIVASSSTQWIVGNFTMSAPGGATAYEFTRQSGSSARYKTVLEDGAAAVRSAGESVFDGLEVRRFTYRDDYLPATDERAGVPLFGFLAEELEALEPSLADHDDEGNAIGYDSRQLVALTVAKVQALAARVDALEAP